jgi:putative ABC transport system permease protein
MGWSRFFRRRYWDDERARELAAHLAIETDDNVARGMTPDAARAAALRKLGNPTLIREEIYTMNSVGFIETVWQDTRYGARLLRRNPTFAAIAILTLALGAGANTAIFELVNAVTLRRLPVERPDQLAEVRIVKTGEGRIGAFMGNRPNLSNPLWERIRTEQRVFSGMLAWGSARWNLTAGGEARRARGIYVSGDFFSTLGVHALLGRVLAPADDVKGCAAPGAVVSHAFWQREYAGDPSAVGRPILLEGHRFDIVGVTPPSFYGVEVGQSFDVALPICAEPLFRGQRSGLEMPDVWFLAAFGRLKPGVTIEQASAQMDAISAGIFAATVSPHYDARLAKDYQTFRLGAVPAATGVSTLRSSYSDPLRILLGVTGLVLLIACANLANLMLARATTREREIAVRLAIGASRRRILRQLLSESLLIAVLGAAAGLVVASWVSAFLVGFLSTDSNPLFVDLRFDWRVFAFTAAIAASACLIFGLTPALRATRTAPNSMMKGGTRSATDSRERFGIRRVLVVVQVALSLVLVVAALLFIGSLRNLTHLDPGFREDGVLTADVDYRKAGVSPDAVAALNRTVRERLAAIPGVDAVAQVYTTPVSGNFWNNNVVVGGVEQPGNVNFNAVGPDYFKALSTPLVEGRDFDERDTASSAKVAVVSEAFVKKYFRGRRTAVGETFQIAGPVGEARPVYTIVGVAHDTKYGDLREEFSPLAYVDVLQEGEPDLNPQFALHAEAALPGVAAEATRMLVRLNPAIAVQYQTVRAQVSGSLLRERLMATLSGFFGGLAVLIATIGLYGVMSYTVARRRVEIGIRMALGADRGSVVKMIVREAGMLLVAGVVIGTGLAIVAGRTATTLLYNVKPWDVATLASAVLMLSAVTLVASWLPARRAARLAPTVALREE